MKFSLTENHEDLAIVTYLKEGEEGGEYSDHEVLTEVGLSPRVWAIDEDNNGILSLVLQDDMPIYEVFGGKAKVFRGGGPRSSYGITRLVTPARNKTEALKIAREWDQHPMTDRQARKLQARICAYLGVIL